MKTNFKTIFFILVATTFSILSCSKEDDTTSSDLKSTDVYIVGITRNTSNKAIPTIWKNGKPTILPSDNNINTTGFRITVSGNDVYAINGNFDETNAIILWKNGISSVVAENAIAEDLIVENGDVYILGRKGNSFRYWKNGVETILTNGLSNNFVSDMVVVNGDVHITGSENNGSKNVVKYWKNGLKTNLTSGITSSSPFDMKVIEKDIHIIGIERNPGTSGRSVLKYWKNGQETVLTSDADGNIFNPAIAISKNGDVHITGKNKYFLNNAPTVLEGNVPEVFDIVTVN